MCLPLSLLAVTLFCLAQEFGSTWLYLEAEGVEAKEALLPCVSYLLECT